MWKEEEEETLPEKELLTQLMFVLSFFPNEILLIAYVERRRRRNIARERVIDIANVRFVFFSQRNTPHRICGKKKKKKHCQ